MKNFSLSNTSVICGILVFAVVFLTAVSGIADDGPQYTPDWDSLTKHPVPEWFRDAKFGIYTHWGVYTVPQYGNEWYPRWMYHNEETWGFDYFNHHKETWGDQAEFGYQDFVPMFKAEKFDAEAWAELFSKAGAQFAGPVAEHHDGFSMWDSALTEWDAAEKGPKRDIVGELEAAIKKRGMKFLTSFHHARNWWFYEVSYTPEKKYHTEDPRYTGLYPEPHEVGAPPNKAYMEKWKGKVIEVVDKYEPDILWFDGALDREQFWGSNREMFQAYKKEMIAHYYNKERDWDRGVALTYKHTDLPVGAGILDIERGRMNKLVDFPWLTDTTTGTKSWCYTLNDIYKSPDELIDVLIDIVSKNGCMLLNVGPKPDGTFPDEAVHILTEMGKWLDINGEAIYGSRPWITYGEGPIQVKEGPMSEGKGDEKKYTARDIRFTTHGDILYAIALDWPESGELLIENLAEGKDTGGKSIKTVELLGSKGRLTWKQDGNALRIAMPDKGELRHAFTVKIMY